MATRTPITILLTQLGTAATTYTVPANSTLTISAATLNNVTAAGVTATLTVTPSGGSALGVVTAQTIPAAGAAPTTVPGLVGQTLGAGGVISALASAATAVTLWLSGYLQQG